MCLYIQTSLYIAIGQNSSLMVPSGHLRAAWIIVLLSIITTMSIATDATPVYQGSPFPLNYIFLSDFNISRINSSELKIVLSV